MSQQAENMRRRLRDLRRATPFRAFEVVMENGDRLPIEHPLHIGFDPVEGGNDTAYIYTPKSFYKARLNAVTAAVVLDTPSPAGASAAG
jgi:hypothetical protein